MLNITIQQDVQCCLFLDENDKSVTFITGKYKDT